MQTNKQSSMIACIYTYMHAYVSKSRCKSRCHDASNGTADREQAIEEASNREQVIKEARNREHEITEASNDQACIDLSIPPNCKIAKLKNCEQASMQPSL